MAILRRTAEEEQEAQAQQPSTLDDARGLFKSAAGASTAPGVTAGTPASVAPAPELPRRAGGGGGFVGIEQYLAANRGATQRLGGQVAGDISATGDRAKFEIDRSAQEFNREADEGTTRIGDDLLGLIGSSPQAITADAAKRAAVLKARDAQYAGPQSLDESKYFTTNATKALGEVSRTRDLLGTSQGIGQLTNRVAGNRTAGARTLDAGLIRSDPNSQGQIAGARSSLDTVDPLLETRRSESAAKAELGRQTSNQTREKTRGALGDAQTRLQTDLDSRLQSARQIATQRQQGVRDALSKNRLQESGLRTAGAQGVQADSERNNVRGAFAGEVPEFIDRGAGDLTIGRFVNEDLPQYQQAIRTLSDEDIEALGITREQYEALTSLDPVSEYAQASAAGTNNVNADSFVEQFLGLQDLGRFTSFRDPNGEINLRNVAGDEDYDRLAALDDLAGTQSTYLNPAERGQFDLSDDLIDFDKKGAGEQYLGILDTLADRTGFTVAGNRKSGGGTFLKKHGAQILSGGIAPRGSGFSKEEIARAVIGSLIGEDAGLARLNSTRKGDDDPKDFSSFDPTDTALVAAQFASDRRVKKNIRAIDSRKILGANGRIGG